MRAGASFRDLMIPLRASSEGTAQIITASEASIDHPPDLLKIRGLLISSGTSPKTFRLEARTAVYDLNKKTLLARDGFYGRGSNMDFRGDMIRGSPENLQFDLTGYFEVQNNALSSLFPKVDPVSRTTWGEIMAREEISAGLWECRSDQRLNPISLLQDLSSNLAEFVKCRNHMEAKDFKSDPSASGRMALVGLEGGSMDLRQWRIQLTRRSALVGPQSVLTCSQGIRLRRELTDAEPLMHLTGAGDIKAWFKTSEQTETSVRSGSFHYVSDRKILQFKGGPLVVNRDGIVLQATEEWQFLRVFDGGRVVLSTGAWNMINQAPTTAE
jgi:hypothetical protein